MDLLLFVYKNSNFGTFTISLLVPLDTILQRYFFPAYGNGGGRQEQMSRQRRAVFTLRDIRF